MYTVKQIRIGLNLSQAELAQKLGIHISTYQRKENGKAQWTILEATKLCQLSGQPITNISF